MNSSPGLVIVAVLVALAIVAVRRRSNHRRDAQLAAQWDTLQRQRATGTGHLLHVTQVYQRARRGSKAVITWCDTGLQQDAWFWNWHVPPGAYLLVSASSGYGPHSHNPHVLYVHPSQVQTWVPAQAAQQRTPAPQ
ncbi:hypothetical protein [Kitasatospora sp. NPDC017646]|uniref:hypothetical protein n=1 Tax=Kitasatospora sp. NPDC017646 TaxID=3364024 RepID=UPI00378F0D84